MPRAGLNAIVVTREAADLADEIGYDALTLTALASRLNVAVPSLYKHVESLDDLRRKVALLAVEELGSAMLAAVSREGRDEPGGPLPELLGLAYAYRGFALRHPGRYAATIRAAPPADRELREASDVVLQPVLSVLERSGLHGDDLIHAARSLRATLHGFASLETAGGFGLPQDVDRSVEWMVSTFTLGLFARSEGGSMGS